MSELTFVCQDHNPNLHSEAFSKGDRNEARSLWKHRHRVAAIAGDLDVWNGLSTLPGAVVGFVLTHRHCTVGIARESGGVEYLTCDPKEAS